MSEVMFVLKSLGLAFILTMLLQIQIGPESLETKAQNWVHTSSIPRFLQGVADGGLKAFATAQHAVVDVINSKNKKTIEAEQASKWSFGFKTPKSTAAAAKSASEEEADND